MNRRRLMSSVVVFGAVAAAARGEGGTLAAADWVKRGNAALRQGQFDAALELYRKAELDLPQSAEIAFNRGVVHYRQGDFEAAAGAFADALKTRDAALEAKAKYNLGNCAYATALQKLTDLPGAIDELRKALSYYRDALQLAPEDDEARENIERAQLLMKDLLDKEKKRQEEEQKKKEQEQQKNPESQPSSQPNDEPQDQQQPQDQQKNDQPQDKQDQQPQQQNQPDQKGDEKKQDKQPQPRPGEKDKDYSKEKAERMLQAIRDKERARRDERQRREAMMVGRAAVERDW